jgi:hypothetical protein
MPTGQRFGAATLAAKSASVSPSKNLRSSASDSGIRFEDGAARGLPASRQPSQETAK